MNAKVGATEFLAAFSRALEAVSAGTPDWTSARRTHLLKGDAVRKGLPKDREASVLHRTFQNLGYAYEEHSKHERVFMYEWLHKDIVAVQGADRSAWAGACWRGRYLIQIVCELENEIKEFEMTMRGMLDVRARLYVGIFFSDSADPGVGEGNWNRRCSDPLRPMSSWSPPSPGEEFPWPFAQGDEILTVVLSKSRPVILGARKHVFSNGTWGAKPLLVQE